MIKLIGVTKKIKHELVLNNVNASFECGKIYGLIGTNTEAMSEALKVIASLSLPTSGDIVYKDKKVGIGVCLKEPKFYENLTILDNLKCLARINNKIGEEEIKKYLDLFSIDYKYDNAISGQTPNIRTKVSIVQAMMEEQKIIILDDPTRWFDLKSEYKLHEILSNKRDEGCLIIITSEKKHFLEDLCDSFYELVKGNLYEI